jgi:hypothetical protein
VFVLGSVTYAIADVSTQDEGVETLAKIEKPSGRFFRDHPSPGLDKSAGGVFKRCVGRIGRPRPEGKP